MSRLVRLPVTDYLVLSLLISIRAVFLSGRKENWQFQNVEESGSPCWFQDCDRYRVVFHAS